MASAFFLIVWACVGLLWRKLFGFGWAQAAFVGWLTTFVLSGLVRASVDSGENFFATAFGIRWAFRFGIEVYCRCRSEY
jgi:hypothetical protein